MKILHYIDEFKDDGGSSLFVKELALDDEKILTSFTGVNDRRILIVKKDKNFLNDEDFFNKIGNEDFDLLLLHSLKFITPKILNVVKKKNIKIGFVSHDYYSICERVVLINNRKMLCSGPYGRNCIYCYMDKYPFLPITRQIRDLLFPFLALFMKRLNWYKNRKKFFDEIFLYIDKIIYPSKKSFEITNRFLNLNDKSVVLKNFQKDILCKKREKEEYPVFAFIGHSAYHKGLHTVLKSFKLIKDGNIKLLLWGDVKNKVKDKRISVKGKFESEKIDQVLASFDVLIFPSIWPETSGRVIFEAAKCGKIIIASNLTPAKELLKDYKKLYIFENNNHMALKSLIEKVVNDWKKIYPDFKYDRLDSVETYRKKLKEVFFDNQN
ncbi:MAG: glycosyltransferase [candidate division WOR-3 bacterium]|jgi:glycosyltransferase involved in cell wall biosynthesis